MSLPTRGIEPVPEETAIIAHAAFPKGNSYLQMRDELGSIYTDDMFADLYPPDGQPAVRPWRLALVTMMQFAENLTDRQAADAVRDRIVWKYVLGLALTDAGFDFSVLSEFRQRLVEHEADQRLLDEMLLQFKARGLLKARGKQRTDSTHVLAAVRNLNQLELVHETLRHALNELALAMPIWLRSWVPGDWFDCYSERTSNYLLPKAETERQRWSEMVGQDGLWVLEQVYQTEMSPWLAQLPAIETLRQVWMQNYYQDKGAVHLREPKDQPPSAQRITSPYDLEARYSTKRDTTWVGYKVHLTETCEPDTPNLIAHKLRIRKHCQVRKYGQFAKGRFAFDKAQQLGIGDEISHEIIGFTTLAGLCKIVQTAVNHLHRNSGKGPVERVGNVIGEINQHPVEQPGGPDLEFDCILRPTPEVSQSQQPFDDMVSVFDAPALPIEGYGVVNRQCEGVEFVG
jgi:transposase